MQFGIFSVGDVTTDPTTGGRRPRPSGSRRGRDRLKAEEVGLDVFATGEHHNPPFVPSSPTTTLAYIAAQTERLCSRPRTTLITTNDPVKIAEDYAILQHLSGGRVDLMMGRGNTGPVYPWFGKDIRDGITLAVENYAPAAPALARGRSSTGRASSARPLQGFTSTPRAARRHAAVRLARLDPQPRDRRAGGVLRRRLLPQPHLLAGQHTEQMVELYRRRFEHYGHGAADQAIVGLGGQVFMRPQQPGRGARVPAVLRQRPGLRPRPVAGGLHRADPADRRHRRSRSSSGPWASPTTSATTSASCSSSTTPACR